MHNHHGVNRYLSEAIKASSLHEKLKLLAHTRLSELINSHEDALARWPDDLLRQLVTVLPLSDFVASSLLSDASLIEALPSYLSQTTAILAPINDSLPEVVTQYRQSLFKQLAQCSNEQELNQQCRKFRRHQMVVIAWRDFLHNDYPAWTTQASLVHLSALAESLIYEAYHWQYQSCVKEWGTPCNTKGESQPMLILGMGKLGGGELNFSSDIDLIFTYPENGETQGARRAIDNSVFFTRLGQRLIKTLDQVTADGFCYRVDMRLRPFGDSGPLVMSFSALEDYYQEQGRDWERYAMIKARVMGVEEQPRYEELRRLLAPFVFRRYIDFSAIQSLRKMKQMIQTEVRRRGLSNNIKLGAGGIREIEFIAQSYQLIRGGREPSLQSQSLFDSLEAMENLSLLEGQKVDSLRKNYLFLRRLENLLQALDDKQTQTLPENEQDQLRLAYAMGVDDWGQLLLKVQENMQQVNHIFRELIGDEENTEKNIPDIYEELWDHADNLELTQGIFAQELLDTALNSKSSIEQRVDDLAQTLMQFHQEMHKKTLGQRGREILNKLMPALLKGIFDHTEGEFGLVRVLSVISKIATRTTYLELLLEHDGALNRLVQLCTASQMITEKLGRYPMLLDELIDPTHFYKPMKLSDYQHELRDFLARIPEDDMEQQMEALRQFKQICILKIAAADILGTLPVMKVSDHLTYLAEAIMQSVVAQAWQQMAEKYGTPKHLNDDDKTGLAIIGYGKVGGWELGYQSDLDIICLHDCPTNSETNGKRAIDSRQFYLRLIQRIVHIFSINTPSGILYEIDMRLRPSGNSGLLACTFETFLDYQKDDAWTWEHQALTRARMIYGEPNLLEKFQNIRQQILSQKRDQATLRKEIIEMRQNMWSQLANKFPNRFHLKNDQGGITDIEFLVQYWVLNFSAKHPELMVWSDNVRIIEQVGEQQLINQNDALQLISAYTKMRNAIHHKNLLKQEPHVRLSRFEDERLFVQKLWNEWLSDGIITNINDE